MLPTFGRNATSSRIEDHPTAQDDSAIVRGSYGGLDAKPATFATPQTSGANEESKVPPDLKEMAIKADAWAKKQRD